MPTKRKPLTRQRKQQRITPYAVELFRGLIEIEQAGLHDRWEEQGGQRRRYLDLSMTLDQELGLRVWESLDREGVLLLRQLEEAVRIVPEG
jgi:hypothetical protein